MRFQRALRCIVTFVAATRIVIADLIINGTVCDITNFSNTDLPFQYAIQTQEDFDSKLGNCDSIIGDVYIGANYVGPFAMNNVTVITGSLATWAVAYGEAAYLNPDGLPGDNYSVPLLTSIQADNLISLGDMMLPTIPAFKSLSMASLETVNNSITIYSNPESSLNFPQLRNITDVQILGGYSSLNMNQLARVNRNLYIDAQNATQDNTLYNNDLNLLNSSPININFASLISVSHISLCGSISSLYMPNLATSVAPLNPLPELDYPWTGIIIQNLGSSLLNVTFPSLWNTTSIRIGGNLDSVSFPSLKTLLGAMEIYPFNPIALDLTPLQAADSITISGNATSANLSSVQNLWSLAIETDGPFDCKQASADWSHMKNTVLPFQSAADNGEEASFLCEDTPAPAPPFHLSEGGAIGIGIGIGIPALALFFLMLKCISKRRVARRDRKESTRRQTFDYFFAVRKMERDEHDAHLMANLDRERGEQYDEDMPPEYTPALATGSVAEGSGGGNAVRDETIEELIRPKY